MRANEYERAARNLRDFLRAFDELMLDLEPIPDLSRLPRWRPKRGRESHAGNLVNEVARLAGPAAQALDISGFGIDYKPSGTMQTRPANPVLLWSTIFNDTPMLDPTLLQVVGRQALGQLEHMRAEQAARQRGLIAALAWFFTFAPRVREAAGLPARSASGRVVTWTTGLIQGLFVTVVGGVLIYPVASWLGWYP